MIKYESRIKKAMAALGVYKAEYAAAVKILGEMLTQYDEIIDGFEPGLGKFIMADDGKLVKNPMYGVLEKLRADILVYSRELGLTPAGLKKMQVEIAEDKKSRLVEALGAIKDETEADGNA